MRDLTEEELKLAPDWATHYDTDFMVAYPVKVTFIDEDRAVDLFQNDNLGDIYDNNLGIRKEDRLIVKPFDITKYEFGDTIQHFESYGSELSLYCVDGFRHVELYKDDAIAIAKALGVTGEDLK